MRWRTLGLPAAAAVLLIAGALKLWATAAGDVAAAALFGCGLLVLGVAARDWIDHHHQKCDDHDT